MATHKTAEIRAKELRLAILRIERGRAHTQAKTLSTASVAREAGVTPALIHNHYPAIAETIRAKRGAPSRNQRDAKHAQLLEEKAKNHDLRRQLEEFRINFAQLATVNEMLLVENSARSTRKSAGNILMLEGRKR